MGGKKAKAADVQKQMESWMKQHNKKKDKPMSKEEADALRYDLWDHKFWSNRLTLTRMTLKCITWSLYQVITIRFIGFKTGISRVCIVFYDILLIELLSNFSFIHIVIRVICSTLSI